MIYLARSMNGFREALPFGPSAFPVHLARALQLRGSSALGRGGLGVNRFLWVTYPLIPTLIAQDVAPNDQ